MSSFEIRSYEHSTRLERLPLLIPAQSKNSRAVRRVQHENYEKDNDQERAAPNISVISGKKKCLIFFDCLFATEKGSNFVFSESDLRGTTGKKKLLNKIYLSRSFQNIFLPKAGSVLLPEPLSASPLLCDGQRKSDRTKKEGDQQRIANSLLTSENTGGKQSAVGETAHICS